MHRLQLTPYDFHRENNFFSIGYTGCIQHFTMYIVIAFTVYSKFMYQIFMQKTIDIYTITQYNEGS